MKDLMKKMMDKGGDKAPDDMQSAAKLKVLGHLKKMASDMMGSDIKDGWAKRNDAASTSPKGDYNHSGDSKPVNDGMASSQGTYDESVAEHNASANEDSGQDPNQEHTHESIDARVQHLKALKDSLAMK